jgi:DNA-binding XRE family transcriptional regulator
MHPEIASSDLGLRAAPRGAAKPAKEPAKGKPFGGGLASPCVTLKWTFNRTSVIIWSNFVRLNEHLKPAYSTKQLGSLVRAERKARGRTQAWVAERAGCRRQTIADLEAGRNVALNILMGALAALGKGLAIVDARVELERLKEIFIDDDADED